MRYMVCYRFSPRGQWYIFKDCKEDDLPATVKNAFLVPDVVEVRIYRAK